MSGDYFQDSALNSVDGKGRVSIPAEFRDVVTRRGAGSSILVALHERADCLIAYDSTYTAQVMEEIGTRFGGMPSVERDRALRMAFGSVKPAAYDDTGRIVLHEDLRELVGIGKSAYFVGLGEYFEIWNPEAYIAQDDLDPRLVRLVAKKIEKFAAKKGGE